MNTEAYNLMDSVFKQLVAQNSPIVTALSVMVICENFDKEEALVTSLSANEISPSCPFIPFGFDQPDDKTFGDFLQGVLSRCRDTNDPDKILNSADIFVIFHHPLNIRGTIYYGKFAHMECSNDFTEYSMSNSHYATSSETAKLLRWDEQEMKAQLGW